MIQIIITVLIVLLAAGFTLYKIYRFFKKPDEDFACSPEKCGNCSLKGSGCSPLDYNKKDQRPS